MKASTPFICSIVSWCLDHSKVVGILVGGLIAAALFSLKSMSMSAYPLIGNPQISIQVNYPGASADVVESAVLSTLEATVLKVPGLLYVESSANNRGAGIVTATFDGKTDMLSAQLEVQNALNAASSRIPAKVRDQGIQLGLGGNIHLLSINVLSENPQFDRIFLSNYARKYLVNGLASIKGVTDVQIFGEMKASVRIWIDPESAREADIDIPTVINAIRAQTEIKSIGRIGAPPRREEEGYELSISPSLGIASAEDFRNIILKSDSQGGDIHLSRIAEVEIGAESYDETAHFNGRDTVMIGVYQKEWGNALDISKAVGAWMEHASQKFPDGVSFQIDYDNARYVKDAYDEVIKTLIMACIIVVLVVALFLRSFRLSVAPAIAIPISLLGAILILSFSDSNINLILLLGFIVSLGIVVDDSILVVERIHYLFRQDKFNSLNALIVESVRQLYKPIVTTTLVLIVVFLPLYFFPGAQGLLFKQLAIAIVVSVIISSLVALLVAPVISGVLYKKKFEEKQQVAPKENFERINDFVLVLTRNKKLSLIILGVVSVVSFWLSQSLSKSFVPEEDSGFLAVVAMLPDGATLKDTESVMRYVWKAAQEDEAIKSVIAVNGWNFIRGNGSNNGIAFLVLEDWSKRRSDDLSLNNTLDRLRGKLSYEGAAFMVLPPPTIPALGSINGLTSVLVDREGRPYSELMQLSKIFADKLSASEMVASARAAQSAMVPVYETRLDRSEAARFNVDINEIYRVLALNVGSEYISDFFLNGDAHKVILQAKEQYRNSPSDIQHYYVRSEDEMIPLSTFVDMKIAQRAQEIYRFNGHRAVSVNISGKIDSTTVDVLNVLEKEAKSLPSGYDIAYLGEARELMESKNFMIFMYAGALLAVYLLLVILFDLWLLPLAVLVGCIIPAFGAMLFMYFAGVSLNIYSQVGIMLSIGLFAKTMILIVDESVDGVKKGVSITEAVTKASRLRMPSILMTLVSFIAGILPLVFASGAGAGARFALGVSLLGGMLLTATIGLVIFPGLLRNFYEKVGFSFLKPAHAQTN